MILFRKKREKEKITKFEGVAYAKVALNFLQALHIDITPENLEDQLWLIYDLYETFEIVGQARKY